MLKLRLTLPGIADVEGWASFVLLDMDEQRADRGHPYGVTVASALALDIIGPDSAAKALRGGLIARQPLIVEEESGMRFEVSMDGDTTSRLARVGSLVHCLVTRKDLNTKFFPVLRGQAPEIAYAAKLNAIANIPVLPEWGAYLWGAHERYKPQKRVVLGKLPDGIEEFYDVPFATLYGIEGRVSEALKEGKITLPVPAGAPTMNWDEIEGLDDYLKVFAPSLASKVTKAHPPLFSPGSARDPRILDLLRKPYEAQADTVQAICEVLKRKRAAFLVGEMGVGKTLMSAAVPYVMLKKDYRVLVMCPGHLVRKWRREIEQTVPDAGTAIIGSWKDMMVMTKYPKLKPFGRQYFIVSKETMKLGAFKRPAAIWRPPVYATKGKRRGSLIREGRWTCPICGQTVLDREGMPIGGQGFDKPTASNQKCVRTVRRWDSRAKWDAPAVCGASLWEVDNTKARKVAVVDLVKRLPNGYFDFLIADECHELKGESAQGTAFGAAAQKAKRTLALTGTLLGGYASDIWYLLWRMSPSMMKANGMRFDNRRQFVSEYGVIERITKKLDVEENRSSRGRQTTRDVEKPGVNPRLFSNHILQTTAFLELSDLQAGLPPYSEEVIGVDMDDEQRDAYLALEGDLRKAARKALQQGSKRLLGALLVNLLSYPDKPYDNPEVVDPQDKKVIAIPRQLSKNKVYPKERVLLDMIGQEVKAGRRVFVYAIYTASRDIAERLRKTISEAG